MTVPEWRRVGYMAAVIAALPIVGFGILILVVAPVRHRFGASGAFASGTGITAYTLGMITPLQTLTEPSLGPEGSRCV